MDPREDEEENSALPVAEITTLQKSSKFNNLFDQLGRTEKERKIAVEALMSITFRAGIECITAEVTNYRAFL